MLVRWVREKGAWFEITQRILRTPKVTVPGSTLRNDGHELLGERPATESTAAQTVRSGPVPKAMWTRASTTPPAMERITLVAPETQAPPAGSGHRMPAASGSGHASGGP